MADPTFFCRGATILFSTTFFNAAGVNENPGAAWVNVVFTEPDGSISQDLIAMIPPVSGFVWTAEWDSRGAGTGAVSWSIHNGDAMPPYSVEDGEVVLTANQANLVTF
jgi:hypothetical protein